MNHYAFLPVYIFRRLFRIGKAEANSAIDKMEDPIKMTEQGIVICGHGIRDKDAEAKFGLIADALKNFMTYQSNMGSWNLQHRIYIWG